MTSRKSSVLYQTGFVVLAAGFFSSAGQAQDVHEYYVERGEYFTQSTTNRPVTALSHELFAYVFPATNGSVLSAALSGPRGLSFSLTDSGGVFQLLDEFLDSIALTVPAPGGIYQFNVGTLNQGLRVFKLSLPGPATGIPPMRVANFPEAQAVDASQSFTLRWDNVTKRGAKDYLAFDLIGPGGDSVFSVTNMVLAQTNLVIPASTLQPNTVYRAYLYIIHYFRLSPDGALPPVWVALETRATKFAIQTLNPAGVLQFAPTAVVANESDGTATITVERTQGSQGLVTADYFTSDGSARADVNYTPVAGTLALNPGDTSSSFTVPLINNTVTNPPLTVHLSLTNATGGATLATRPHANLTILDSQSAPGLNVNAYSVGRAEFYQQTDAQPPVQSTLPAPSRFFASVHPAFPGSITNATVQLPNGTSRVLSSNGDFPDYNENFPSRSSMNAAFRSGKYQLHFDTISDGSFSPTLVLGAERSFSVPHLTNWVESQAIDPTNSFTLRWAPFIGATSNDFVIVRISDSTKEYVFRTPGAFEPRALPGATSSVTIPANTFDYGASYFVNLEFAKVLVANTRSYPGARGCIVFFHTTEFYLNTVSAPPP